MYVLVHMHTQNTSPNATVGKINRHPKINKPYGVKTFGAPSLETDFVTLKSNLSQLWRPSLSSIS